MSLIFGDEGHHGRQLDDLMTRRRRIERARIGRERGPATAASGGDERHEVRDAFGGQKRLEVRRMSGLAARFSAGGLLRGSRRLRLLNARRFGMLEAFQPVEQIANGPFVLV
jgi:hypothetical protein